jgi:hypothetical protein
MLVASASSSETAPSMLFVMRELFTEWLDDMSDSFAEKLAVVLVEKSFDLLTSCVDADFSDVLNAVALESFEASENAAEFFLESDAACCADLDDDASVEKSSDFDAFADKLLFEARFKLPDKEAALWDPVVSVAAALLVALVADPPFAAWVLLAALPTVPEVLPPLEDVLFDTELPVVPALPPGAALALFAVEPKAAVPLLVSVLFAEASSFAAAELTSLALSDSLAAKEFFVALESVSLLAAEADTSSDELLLALACCAVWWLVLKLAEELSLFELSSVNDLLSVVW